MLSLPGPVLATLIGPSSEKGGGCTRWVEAAATMKLPHTHTHTPRGHSSGCSGRGEIKLAVLRDSESEQNDIFNIKYTQGLLGLSIQDEGERETL